MQSNSNTKFWTVFFLASLVFVAFIGVVAMPQATEAAPAAAPTPVSAAPRGVESNKVNFYDAQVLTADNTSTCVDVSAFEKADLYYNIDLLPSNVNTTTVTLQHGNSPAALVDGVAVASTVAADAAALNQFQIFGGFLCLKVDVTDASTGTVIITANALVK